MSELTSAEIVQRVYWKPHSIPEHYNESLVEVLNDSFRDVKVDNNIQDEDLVKITSDTHGSALSFFMEGFEAGIFRMKEGVDKMSLGHNNYCDFVSGVEINPDYKGKFINLGDLVDVGPDSLLILKTLDNMFKDFHMDYPTMDCPYKQIVGNHDVDGTGASNGFFKEWIDKGYAKFNIPVKFNDGVTSVSHAVFKKEEWDGIKNMFGHFKEVSTDGTRIKPHGYNELKDEMEKIGVSMQNLSADELEQLDMTKKIEIRNAINVALFKSNNGGGCTIPQGSVFTPFAISTKRTNYKPVASPTIWSDLSNDDYELTSGKNLYVHSISGHEHSSTAGFLRNNDKQIVGLSIDFDKSLNYYATHYPYNVYRELMGFSVYLTLDTKKDFKVAASEMDVSSRKIENNNNKISFNSIDSGRDLKQRNLRIIKIITNENKNIQNMHEQFDSWDKYDSYNNGITTNHPEKGKYRKGDKNYIDYIVERAQISDDGELNINKYNNNRDISSRNNKSKEQILVRH